MLIKLKKMKIIFETNLIGLFWSLIIKVVKNYVLFSKTEENLTKSHYFVLYWNKCSRVLLKVFELLGKGWPLITLH